MADNPRLLIVGEAPGPNTDPRHPVGPLPMSSAGGRLCNLMGLTTREYLRRTDRINLLPVYPGGNWSVIVARAAADNLRCSGLLRGRNVILLGSRVIEAFYGKSHIAMCSMGLSGRGQCMIGYIPHPSGRNLWYNDKKNVRKIKKFLREVLSCSA